MNAVDQCLNSPYKDFFVAWRYANLVRVSQNMDPQALGATLICLTRNELWRLPHLLAHYRALGLQRFVFIDNDSTDDTRAFLSQEADVDLYVCPDKYTARAKQGWQQKIMAEYGYNRWYLVADADEFIVYDGCPDHSINDLAARAEQENNHRVRGLMLDMYGDGPMSAYAKLETQDQVRDYCRYFDQAGYAITISARGVSVEGGPRIRMMRDMGLTGYNPEITKYPLIFASPDTLCMDTHFARPFWKNYPSKCLLGILHYKYSQQDFLKIEDALARGQYWNNSVVYRCLAQWMERFPDRSLVYEGSGQYAYPHDLAKAGLISPIDWTSGGPVSRLSLGQLAVWKDSFQLACLLRMYRKRLDACFESKFDANAMIKALPPDQAWVD